MKALAVLLAFSSAVAFPTTKNFQRKPSMKPFDSTPAQLSEPFVSSQEEELPGVKAMEEWLQNSSPAASWSEHVIHARFSPNSNLRGLKWTGPMPSSKRMMIASIPATKTLQTDYSSTDWDADLAFKILEVLRKGAASEFCAYIDLLNEGGDRLKPTAPDALRHWSLEERKLLASSPAGMRLLELNDKQQEAWQRKYESCCRNKDKVSFTDFTWAMEAVYSRSFRGQSVQTSNALIPLLAPIVAALVGFVYMSNNPDPSIAVLGSLALAAVAPTLLQKEQQVVCLLPFIDSANHSPEADSRLEFDPRTDAFQLTIGSSCVKDDSRQLYINYGSRSDAELLINYGFLTGLDRSIVEAESSCRQYLAREYLKRNQ